MPTPSTISSGMPRARPCRACSRASTTASPRACSASSSTPPSTTSCATRPCAALAFLVRDGRIAREPVQRPPGPLRRQARRGRGRYRLDRLGGGDRAPRAARAEPPRRGRPQAMAGSPTRSATRPGSRRPCAGPRPGPTTGATSTSAASATSTIRWRPSPGRPKGRASRCATRSRMSAATIPAPAAAARNSRSAASPPSDPPCPRRGAGSRDRGVRRTRGQR